MPRTHLPRFLKTTVFATLLSFGAAAHGTLIFGFEASEGYELGALAGQEGWTESGSASGMTVINDPAAKTGSRSLAVAAGMTGSARVISPTFLSEGYTALTLSLKTSTAPGGANPNVNFSRFRIVLGDTNNPGASTTSVEFGFRWAGGTDQEYQLNSQSWTSGSSTTERNSLGATFAPTDWNDFSFVLAADAKSYSVFMNGIGIVTDALLPSDAQINAIHSLSIWRTDYTGTVFYDNITNVQIPEPATTAFLLIAVAGLGAKLLMRRKAKAGK